MNKESHSFYKEGSNKLRYKGKVHINILYLFHRTVAHREYLEGVSILH